MTSSLEGMRPVYDCGVLAVAGDTWVNGVILASAIVPPVIVAVGAWLFLRAGRRHDERERAKQG